MAASIRIAVFYAIAAGVWIFASDQLLENLVVTTDELTRLQSYKGLVFIAVTSMILFTGLLVEFQKRQKIQERLVILNQQLEERVASRTTELQTANMRLTELDRLKTQFIVDISHSLRTPINTMVLRLDMIDDVPAEKLPRHLESIKKQAKHLYDLVNDVLVIENLQSLEEVKKPGAVDLNAIIVHILEVHRPLAEDAGLELGLRADDNLPAVWGVKNLITQVVSNLVSNGIKYTQTGSITVTTAFDSVQQRIVLQVQDTGMGIAPEEIPHLFDRFYRGNTARRAMIPGTGLGLGIVKEILDLYDGDIGVESVVNAGTTFTVRLPVMQAIAEAV